MKMLVKCAVLGACLCVGCSYFGLCCSQDVGTDFPFENDTVNRSEDGNNSSDVVKQSGGGNNLNLIQRLAKEQEEKPREMLFSDDGNTRFFTKGLKNFGATCYMNAVLQCLCNLPALGNYFLRHQNVFEGMSNNTLTKQLFDVFYNLWINDGEDIFSADLFKNLVGEIPMTTGRKNNVEDNPFCHFAPADSCKLLSHIVNVLSSELGNNNVNVIENLFYTFNDHLRLLIQSFLGWLPVGLDLSNPFNNGLNQFAPVMVVNVSAGDIINGNKFDVNKFRMVKLQRYIYKLSSFVSFEKGSGHYVAYVYNEKCSKWFLYNDKIVQEWDGCNVVGSPYILFYTCQNVGDYLEKSVYNVVPKCNNVTYRLNPEALQTLASKNEGENVEITVKVQVQGLEDAYNFNSIKTSRKQSLLDVLYWTLINKKPELVGKCHYNLFYLNGVILNYASSPSLDDLKDFDDVKHVISDGDTLTFDVIRGM